MEEKEIKLNNRNTMLRNNIIFSGVLKAVSLCTSFLVVPVTLNYLDKEPYGLWMAISSMAFWIFTFDIGLGNGLRNYLTAAISINDYKAARAYISSAFAMLVILALIIGLISALLIKNLDFCQILNTTNINNSTLQTVILSALILTLIQFVVKNIGFIYVAMQKYAINDLLTAGGAVLALITIFILSKTTTGNLFYVVTTFMGIPVLVFLFGGLPLFTKYPAFRPSLKCIDIDFSKNIILKGTGFFIIQITSCLIIFGGSNFFISHYQGPEAVTTYNIAYRFFNLLIIGYTIIIAPIWNAYTDAYVKNDWTWIRQTFSKTLLFWGLTVFAGFIMLSICNIFYLFWIGHSVTIPLSVSAAVLTFITFFNLNNCVTYLLNGLNTIRVQILTSIFCTVAYLIAIVIYGRIWGIEGIVLSMAICYALMSLIHLYQCRLIICQKATGIWKK